MLPTHIMPEVIILLGLGLLLLGLGLLLIAFALRLRKQENNTELQSSPLHQFDERLKIHWSKPEYWLDDEQNELQARIWEVLMALAGMVCKDGKRSVSHRPKSGPELVREVWKSDYETNKRSLHKCIHILKHKHLACEDHQYIIKTSNKRSAPYLLQPYKSETSSISKSKQSE